MKFNLKEERETKDTGGVLKITYQDIARSGILIFPCVRKQLVLSIFFSALLHLTSIFVLFETKFSLVRNSISITRIERLEVQMNPRIPSAALASHMPDKALALPPEQIMPQHDSEEQRRAIKRSEADVSTAQSAPVFSLEITPVVPLPLLAKGTRGSVSAIFRVEQSGAIVDIEITDSQPSGVFDSVAIAAISSARIKEGTVPSGQQLGVTIIFDPSGTQANHQILHAK